MTAYIDEHKACREDGCSLKYECWRYVRPRAARQSYVEPDLAMLTCGWFWPLAEITPAIVRAERQRAE